MIVANNIVPHIPQDTLLARVKLTPVSPADFEALVSIRIAAMRESLERVGRFDPERARERLRKNFAPEFTHFIVLDGQRVGFYALRPQQNGFHLDHFYIHPSAQNQKIGSCVLTRVIQGCAPNQSPIHVGALKESGSNRFYQRHGFIKISEDEWDIHYVLPPVLMPRATQ